MEVKLRTPSPGNDASVTNDDLSAEMEIGPRDNGTPKDSETLISENVTDDATADGSSVVPTSENTEDNIEINANVTDGAVDDSSSVPTVTDEYAENNTSENLLPGCIYFCNFSHKTDVVELIKGLVKVTEQYVNKYEGYGYVILEDIRKRDECIAVLDKLTYEGKQLFVGKLDNVFNAKEIVMERVIKEGKIPQYMTITFTPDYKRIKFMMELQAKCGKIERCQIKQMTKQNIIVKARNYDQAKELMRFKSSHVANVTATSYLNECKGVITTWMLANDDEQDLKLFNEDIVGIERIKRRIDGELVNTNSAILTFNRSDLPVKINYGWIDVEVKPYIPRPLQCYNCQKYGHSKFKCKYKNMYSRCVVCGTEFNGSHECSKIVKCSNCGEDHKSNSKDCVEL